MPSITERTHDVLKEVDARGQLDPAWQMLMAATPSTGKTREALRQARSRWIEEQTPTSLAEGLHISRIWGNAGYDFLGLESGEAAVGGPVVVRYETKGVPDGDGEARIYLSDNERRVATRVRQEPTGEPGDDRYVGKWKLIAVEPQGRAIDITPLVVDLLDHPKTVLKSLLKQGLSPDGLILRLRR